MSRDRVLTPSSSGTHSAAPDHELVGASNWRICDWIRRYPDVYNGNCGMGDKLETGTVYPLYPGDAENEHSNLVLYRADVPDLPCWAAGAAEQYSSDQLKKSGVEVTNE